MGKAHRTKGSTETRSKAFASKWSGACRNPSKLEKEKKMKDRKSRSKDGSKSGLEGTLKEEKRREGEFEGGVEGERGKGSHKKEKECQEKEGGNSRFLSKL